jgi:hypothetical protein
VGLPHARTFQVGRDAEVASPGVAPGRAAYETAALLLCEEADAPGDGAFRISDFGLWISEWARLESNQRLDRVGITVCR